MPERLDLPDDELARLYQEGVSAYALGLRYGCTSNTIGKRLRAQGITLHRTSARVRAISRDELEGLIGRGLSDAQIALRFNVCHATIRKLRHTYNLQPHPKYRKRSTKDTKDTNGPVADAAPVVTPQSGRESTKDTKDTNGPVADAAPAVAPQSGRESTKDTKDTNGPVADGRSVVMGGTEQ